MCKTKTNIQVGSSHTEQADFKVMQEFSVIKKGETVQILATLLTLQQLQLVQIYLKNNIVQNNELRN